MTQPTSDGGRGNHPSEIVLPDRVVKALEAIAARLESDQPSAPAAPPQLRLTHSMFTELRFGLGSVAFNQPATQIVTSKIVSSKAGGNQISYPAGSLPSDAKSLSLIYPAPKAAVNEDLNPSREHTVQIDPYIDPVAVQFYDKTSGEPSRAAILASFVTR